MLVQQLLHDTSVFLGKGFLCEVSEEDVLLFAMMAPVSVILDEIDGNIDENRVCFLLAANLFQLLFEQTDHAFYQPVLDHQGTNRHHEAPPGKVLSVMC